MKIYVIAHTWRDTGMTIEHFFTPEKTVKRLSELVSDEYGFKASPEDDPQEYLDGYSDFVSSGLVETSVYLVMEVIDL
jgi:hypothetical protein